jgi:hypothetical protein
MVITIITGIIKIAINKISNIEYSPTLPIYVNLKMFQAYGEVHTPIRKTGGVARDISPGGWQGAVMLFQFTLALLHCLVKSYFRSSTPFSIHLCCGGSLKLISISIR